MSSTEVYAGGRRNPLKRLANRFSARSRARRYETFARVLELRPGDRILDVGCGSLGLRALDSEHEIVGLDAREQPGYPGRFVRADARSMPFADGEFDVAYCNSLIEHLPPADRARLASEIRRVAGRWLVQTPNRAFPLEPHVLLPLFQFLPPRLKLRLWRFGAAGGPYEEIELLDARELAELFPEAEIVRERVGPLTKSLMAVGPRERLATVP